MQQQLMLRADRIPSQIKSQKLHPKSIKDAENASRSRSLSRFLSHFLSFLVVDASVAFNLAKMLRKWNRN